MEIRAQGLLSVVGDYHDEVEASLQFLCGGRDPVGEFLTGQITLRSLRVLVTHLPLDSPAAIARRGNDWTTSEWLEWDNSAQLRILNTTLANLFRKDGTPAAKPELIPTPSQNESVEEALEREAEEKYQEQVRAEMDDTVQRIFANPN